MNNCTSYDYIQFDKGILDNVVDAVYVILLKDSHRTQNVYKQLNYYKLSKNNYIQINDKFTKCPVPLYKQTTGYHIIYNTINILKHANNNNFNNILVFQDDFILDEQIKDKTVINDLDNFVNNNDFSIYYIGCCPFIFYPHSLKHYKSVFTLATHSVIYSKSGRNKLIENYDKHNQLKITDNIALKSVNCQDDDFLYNFILSNKYFYYKPLCYQPFEDTENKKTWSCSIFDFFIKKLKLDKDPKFGFKLIYNLFTFINILLFFLIVYIIIKLVK